jgi:putative glutamine amidotransferase
MAAPLIGITTSRTLSSANYRLMATTEAYVKAILNAGGIPVLLPIGLKTADLTRLRDTLDGILLSGGGDIHPSRFNGRTHPRVYDVDLNRDEMEIELVRLAADTDWPFLGICRGIQVINVALGGNLCIDIGTLLPGALRHDCFPDMPRDHLAHKVSFQPGCILENISSGSELVVNSLHHQALDRLAPELEVLATAPDGLVEAVGLKNHPFGLGVQWHPEWLPGSPANQALFHAFMEAAR